VHVNLLLGSELDWILNQLVNKVTLIDIISILGNAKRTF